MLARRTYAKATFFPYTCHEGAIVSRECDPAVGAYAKCYIANGGDTGKCGTFQAAYVAACEPVG